MHRAYLLLFATLLFACSCEHDSGKLLFRPTPQHLRTPTVFQKGIGLGLYYEHAGRPYETMFEEIASTGADHVELVLHWTQTDIRATEIVRSERDTVKDQRLLEAMDGAHRSGLRVFLFPIIDVENRKTGEWRGTIKPDNWDAWWASYEKYIMHYAELAEKGGAAMFSVGSELVSTEEMCDRWEPLIQKVRAVYSGKLIYSANWDHYKQVCFWNKLDFAGMTAYYVLTNSRTPNYEDLVSAWKRIRTEIITWEKTLDVPLIITEIGYPAQDGTNMHPWDYTTKDPIDLEEQELCYKAFREVWEGEERLAGVYFWNWYEPGGTSDKSYTPRGKPAEQVLRGWFQKPTSELRPTPNSQPESSAASTPAVPASTQGTQ
jgi:hypothetical protein